MGKIVEGFVKQRMEMLAMGNDTSKVAVVSEKLEKEMKEIFQATFPDATLPHSHVTSFMGVKIFTVSGMPENTMLSFKNENDALQFIDMVESYKIVFLITDEQAVRKVISVFEKMGLVK
jgi:hypothetical protein